LVEVLLEVHFALIRG